MDIKLAYLLSEIDCFMGNDFVDEPSILSASEYIPSKREKKNAFMRYVDKYLQMELAAENHQGWTMQ